MNFYLLALYAIITAVIVLIAHVTLGRRWRRNEIARRVVGHAIPLGIAALFVPSGLMAWNTIVAIGIGTIAGGIVVAFTHVEEGEKRKEERAEGYRRIIINDEENF